MRKRWKRKRGYITPNLSISKRELIKENLFVNPHYSDWDDWRDGFRDWYGDNKKIKKIDPRRSEIYPEVYSVRIKMNKKQKKLLYRRRRMKFKDP